MKELIVIPKQKKNPCRTHVHVYIFLMVSWKALVILCLILNDTKHFTKRIGSPYSMLK